MQGGALIAGLVSAVAVVVSLIFLARQTRESARQSLLANQIAGTQATRHVYEKVDQILYYFLENPEVRPYFYEGVATPGAADDQMTPDLRVRVLIMGEIVADALDNGLDTLQTIDAAAGFRTAMDEYTTFVLTMSPTVAELIRDRHGWWPNVEAWQDARQRNSTGTHRSPTS